MVRFRPGQLGRFANRPLAGRQGGKRPAPLTLGLERMPTAGKTPSSGLLSIGREPHAIHGVTLPFSVILTAHRFQSTLHSARQTASGFGEQGRDSAVDGISDFDSGLGGLGRWHLGKLAAGDFCHRGHRLCCGYRYSAECCKILQVDSTLIFPGIVACCVIVCTKRNRETIFIISASMKPGALII